MTENGLSDHLVNDPATQRNDNPRIIQDEIIKLQQNMQQNNQNMVGFFQQMLQQQAQHFEAQIQKQSEQIHKQSEQIQKLYELIKGNDVDKTKELKEILQIPSSAKNHTKENQLKKTAQEEETEVGSDIIGVQEEEKAEKAVEFKHLTSADIIQLANYKNRVKTVEAFNCNIKQVTIKNILHTSLSPNNFRDNLDAVMETSDNTEELKKFAKEIRFEVFQQKKGSLSSVISEENDITNTTKISGIHEVIFKLIDELPLKGKRNLDNITTFSDIAL